MWNENAVLLSTDKLAWTSKEWRNNTKSQRNASFRPDEKKKIGVIWPCLQERKGRWHSKDIGIDKEVKRKRGRPKQRSKDTTEKDLKWFGLNQVDTEDQVQWKNLVEVEIGQRLATRKEKGEKVRILVVTRNV